MQQWKIRKQQIDNKDGLSERELTTKYPVEAAEKEKCVAIHETYNVTNKGDKIASKKQSVNNKRQNCT